MVKTYRSKGKSTGKRWSCPCAFNWVSRHGGVLGEWKYSSTHSLTSALDGGEWSASRSGRFTPKERDPNTRWIRSWVSPSAVLDKVVKRRIPSPRWESNPRTPIVQSVAQLYTDWAIIAVTRKKEGINIATRVWVNLWYQSTNYLNVQYSHRTGINFVIISDELSTHTERSVTLWQTWRDLISRNVWASDRFVTTPVTTKGSTWRKNADTHTHTHLGRDSNPRSKCSSGQRKHASNHKQCDRLRTEI
jgi:hypothetical protein